MADSQTEKPDDPGGEGQKIFVGGDNIQSTTAPAIRLSNKIVN
jgi:hypothetical protein